MRVKIGGKMRVKISPLLNTQKPCAAGVFGIPCSRWGSFRGRGAVNGLILDFDTSSLQVCSIVRMPA